MRNLLAIIAATCGMACGAATAAEPARSGSPEGTVSGVPPRPAIPVPGRAVEGSPAARLVPASGSPIVLEAGKGTLIRLSRAAATVFIANPDVADVQVKSPSLIYLTAKAPGQTALYAVDAEDRVLLNAPVRVEHDLSRLRHSIHALAPGQNVTVSSVENALVLGGTVASAGEAATVSRLATAIAKETKGEVSNRMAVATPNQVNIRVKVAEVNREVLKALGVNWRNARPEGFTDRHAQSCYRQSIITDQNTISFLRRRGQCANPRDARRARTREPAGDPGRAEPDRDQWTAGSLPGRRRIPGPGSLDHGQRRYDDHDRVQAVRRGARCHPDDYRSRASGSENPLQVSDLSTAGADNPERHVQIPALTVRRAETTVELGSGQSFVLGGLLQDRVLQNISKIPWLGDVPVLGQLFRSERFKRNETELVHHRHALSRNALQSDGGDAGGRVPRAA